MAELVVDRLRRRQKADFGAVEAGALQLLDRRFECFGVREHGHRLADSAVCCRHLPYPKPDYTFSRGPMHL